MDKDKRILTNIYEINTTAYLNRLANKYQHLITLATIPDEDIDEIASFGMDTVWLMGVWQRSPAGVDVALHDDNLLLGFHASLPDFAPEDVIGSAYAIKSYVVAERFGGNVALQQLRDRLKSRKIKLILDFVPNHTAIDGDWVDTHPEYYIQADSVAANLQPNWYQTINDITVAFGRDPNYPPWSDTAQLNAFSSAYRSESIATLTYLATLCDGVRCDMAMLMINDIFHRTWHDQAGSVPGSEYWTSVISAVRATSPEFIFISESYWDTQPELINQGFDYCYDKDTTDLIINGDVSGANTRVDNLAPIAEHLLHFLENHDENRIAHELPNISDLETAVKSMLLLPGPKLWYDGQFQGAKVRTSVWLQRSPLESTNQQILELYTKLLQK